MGAATGDSGTRRAEIRAELRTQIQRSFPSIAHAAASPAIELLPPADFGPIGLIHESNNRPWPGISFNGETLEIPDRIYNEFPTVDIDRLPPASRAAAGCIYTRHNDGHVRERALGLVLSHDAGWSAPFIVALLGEYVVEICTDIELFLRTRLDEHPETARGLRFFADSNPTFMALTRERAISYWAEYNRLQFLDVNTYPALRALNLLEGQPA